MNVDLLLWIYVINATLLLNHEIDSGYWQEWKLIKPTEENGIGAFLILHFPLIFIILYGLILVHDGKFLGLIISLLVSASGIFAFAFHTYHLRKDRLEFNTAISRFILISTLIVSSIQLIITFISFF